MFNQIKLRWYTQGGYRDVLKIAIPLILSTGAWSILLFVDRMFLAWYSPEAIAAAMPAGMASFALMCFFIGTAAYVGTFVAQYYGAEEHQKVGAIVWQGIYLAMFALPVIFVAFFLADLFFASLGHTAEVAKLEADYFKLLMFSAPFLIASNALSSFFSGLGKTIIVMWVSVLIMMINILLDYLFIFGFWGLPAMGVSGAAIATNIAICCGFLVYTSLFLSQHNQSEFHTYKNWRFDYRLSKRLIHFGLPNGVRLFIDMSAFTAFLFFVGTLGVDELAASNVAFNINALSFLPMLGLMIAVSVLVGQRIGEGKPEVAEKLTWSAMHIAVLFFGSLAFLYVTVPEAFIWPFTLHNGLQNLSSSVPLIIVLLRFVALFGFFDAMFLVFLGALEGAGDTRFVLKMSIFVSWFLLLLPCYLYIRFFKADLLVLWVMITLNIILYCGLFYLRFRFGPWRSMRVIE